MCGRCAWYLKARPGRYSRLWQNRFHACAVGGSPRWSDLRRVEMGRIRAGIPVAPRGGKWSRVEPHHSGQDLGASPACGSNRTLAAPISGGACRANRQGEAAANLLSCATHAGQPFWDEEFVEEMRA